MRMRWIVAERCTVLFGISARCSATLHRPARRARAERGQQRVGAQPQLRAEAAADVRRHDAHLLLRDAERLGHVGRGPGDHLVRGPERELVAVPRGDASRAAPSSSAIRAPWCRWRRAARAPRRRRRRSRRPRVSAAPPKLSAGLRRVLHRGEVERALRSRVLDAHQVRRRARLLEGLGHDDRDRLVVVLDLGPPSSSAVLKLPLPSLPAFCGGDDGDARRARPCAAARSIETMRPLAMAEPTM